MLEGGAQWAIGRGYGRAEDLDRIEEHGCIPGARPEAVSHRARQRQREEMGTLGSGNHYLEVQEVTAISDDGVAAAFGLGAGRLSSVSIAGRAALATRSAPSSCARWPWPHPLMAFRCPISSSLAHRSAPRSVSAISAPCAPASIARSPTARSSTDLTRRVFARFFPEASLPVLFDVSHNTCKEEEHETGGERRRLFVHRKGATRAFGAGHPDLPAAFAATGQPVFIGGSMGTPQRSWSGRRCARSRPSPRPATAPGGD